MAWRSSGNTNAEMVSSLRRKFFVFAIRYTGKRGDGATETEQQIQGSSGFLLFLSLRSFECVCVCVSWKLSSMNQMLLLDMTRICTMQQCMRVVFSYVSIKKQKKQSTSERLASVNARTDSILTDVVLLLLHLQTVQVDHTMYLFLQSPLIRNIW